VLEYAYRVVGPIVARRGWHTSIGWLSIT